MANATIRIYNRITESEMRMTNVQYRFNQALQFHQSGRIREAINLYLEILPQQKSNSQLLYMLGMAYLQIGQHLQAAEQLQRSLDENPGNSHAPFAHINLGIALQNLRRYNEALASFDRALAIKPNDAEAYLKRGNILQDLQRYEEALESYDKALALRPDHAMVYNNRGNVLKDLKRLDEALESYNKALNIKPDYAVAYNNRGNVLKDLKRLDEALESLDRALELQPTYASAFNNHGNVLRALKRPEDALDSYDKALENHPTYAEAYVNRGNALEDLKRFEDALASYDKALELEPNNAETYVNRGIILYDLKRFEEALACYDMALSIKPGYAEASWNKSILLILTGRYLEGWELYENRLRRDSGNGEYYSFPKPAWRGQTNIQGRRLLIHSEQGIGDTIQFCRYIPHVKAMGAEILFEAPMPVVSFLSTLKCPMTVFAKGTPLPEFDAYCPLMSLPYAFKTTVETIPASIPYLFSNADKVREWKKKLGDKGRLRVGLVWSGSAFHKKDADRSVRLSDLLPLMDLPVEWHSLQKEYRPHDLETLGLNPMIQQHQDEFEDFSDTVALIECLDVVVSVDTSVAHAAGALGKPVWILLPLLPDYRWMLDRVDSPWYPSAKLFRQPKEGDWQSVISMVKHDLLALTV